MSKFRLYCGLVRNGKWYNYTEINPLTGGVLTMLDGQDKSGAVRLINLMKGSTKKFLTEDGEEYELKPEDYNDMYVADTWKIGYEAIKLFSNNPYPIIPENFYCPRCSMPKMERFTEVNESWQKLIEDGKIDEFFLNNPDPTFDVDLPDPIVIQPGRTIAGGSFTHVTRRPVIMADAVAIHKDPFIMSNEASVVYAIWDASIVKIEGMSERDLNIIKRIPDQSFTKKYIAISQANIDAMDQSDADNILGIDAPTRKISCQFCNNEIGGYLDMTNFFLPLLPKRSRQNRTRNIPK